MGATRDALPSHRWAVVLSSVGALLVAVFLAVAVLTAGPPAAANLTREVSDGAPTALRTDGAVVEVAVPEGWVVSREGGAAVVTLTPDGAVRMRVEIVRGDPAALIEARGERIGAIRHEALASGLDVVHADVDGGGIVAAIEVDGGAAVVTSEILGDVDPTVYRPAFAQLLEGVRA